MSCEILICDQPDDLDVGGGIFATTGFTFVISCLPGFFCFLNEQTVTIPANIIPPVIVPPLFGGQITLRLQGCLSLIVRVLPGNATPTQIAQAVASMQAEWASQQAMCNFINPPGDDLPGNPQPPAPPPVAPPPGGGTTGDQTGKRVDVCNTAQTFTATCVPPQAGDPVTVTIAAKKYCVTVMNGTPANVALAQAQVNAYALSDATTQANAAIVCVSICPSVIDNINTGEFDLATCCFAGGVNNLIFFAGNTFGVREIMNTTILAGNVGYPIGDSPGYMCYAPSSDRVYVNVNSAVCYVSVIQPTPISQVATFNNGLAFDFNFLVYGTLSDRVFGTQSDGTNQNLIVINPNTNTIVNTVVFSVDAANEFQGGIDVDNLNNRIYIGRAGNILANQMVRVYNQTTQAHITDFTISGLIPHWILYVQEFNRLFVGVEDFVTNAASTLILNATTGATIAQIALPFPITSGPMGYNTISKQVYVNVGGQVVVIDAATATQSCIVNTINDIAQMAFNTDNNKMYFPNLGLVFFQTLG